MINTEEERWILTRIDHIAAPADMPPATGLVSGPGQTGNPIAGRKGASTGMITLR